MVSVGLVFGYISGLGYTRAFMAGYEGAGVAKKEPMKRPGKVDFVVMHRAGTLIVSAILLLSLASSAQAQPTASRGSPLPRRQPAGAGAGVPVDRRHPRRPVARDRRRGCAGRRDLGRRPGGDHGHRRGHHHLGPGHGGDHAGGLGAGRRQRHLHPVGVGGRDHLHRSRPGSTSPRACTACAGASCRWAGCRSVTSGSARGWGTAFTPSRSYSSSARSRRPSRRLCGWRARPSPRSRRTSITTGTTRPRRAGSSCWRCWGWGCCSGGTSCAGKAAPGVQAAARLAAGHRRRPGRAHLPQLRVRALRQLHSRLGVDPLLRRLQVLQGALLRSAVRVHRRGRHRRRVCASGWSCAR